MKRISVRIVLSVVLLVVMLLAVTLSLLLTQTGSRWLLDQVPGLTVEGYQGVLLTDWRAERVHWQQDDLSVQLNTVHMQLRPSCLLRSALCLDTLEVTRLELNLPEAETPTEPEQSITLPDLKLPLSIEVKRVQLGELILNGESLLSDAGLRARWLDDGIHIGEIALSYQDYALQGKGKITPSAGWPLDVQLSAQLPMPDAPRLDIEAQLTGSVQNLTLNAQTQGYLAADIKGQVQALDADLPAQLEIKLASLQVTPDLPETLQLADVIIDLQGDMQKGYHLAGLAQLPNTAEQMQLSVAALLKTSGAQLQALRLSASAEAYVALEGVVDWQNDLQADAQLQWQHFPWHNLLAQDDIPVQLKTLNGQISYNAGAYQGQIDGDLSGPAGPFSLTTAFDGDLEQVQLHELLIEAGQGRLQGTANVGFADGVQWLADIQASKLNPAYWLAELPGELAGAIHSQGFLRDGQLQVDATADLKGTLRGSLTQLDVDLHGTQHGQETPLWQLNKADIRFGDNRITATAQIDQALAAELQLDLPRLVQLWPGLAGKAQGTIKVSGSLAEPLGVAQLEGRGIAYQGNRVGKLTLQGQLLAAQQAHITLDAERIWSGETEFGVLHIDGQGSLETHSGSLSLKGPLLDTQLKLSGAMQDGDWLGQLQQLLLSSHQQNWALEKATAIVYRKTGELTVAAHCLKDGQSSLCAGEQRLLPQTKIDYQLRNFPLATLQPWLPADAQIAGQVNGAFNVELLDKGPLGKVQLDAGKGQLRVKNNDEWETFAWQTLKLNSDLTEQAIKSVLQLTGADSGHLELVADIDPLSEQKKLRGHFLIENVDLSVLRPFIDQVSTIDGVLEGRGTLAGTLLAPSITGFVQIRDAQLSGGELPVPFEQLQLRADIKGEQLQLSGGWRSGENGSGSIQGRVQWAQQLLVDIDVKGEQLPLHAEPYANIEIAPDLHISLKQQRLFVSGEVAVPKGLITIPQLPEQAVRVSSDARVIGQAEPEAGLQVAMDITLNAGAERLRFSGFGLTADIRGNLQVGDNLAGRGMLELLNGRYRAYGQRLQLRRARLLFAGPLSQPFLDIEAVRVTGDVTAGLRLTGPATQPRSEIFSNPAMSQEQALSWLLLGRPLQGGGEDGNVMAQAALALGLMGTAPITNKLAEVIGVQDFLLESEGSGLTSSVVASGRISERISLRYGVGVFEPASTLALRYELTKRIYLEAASGLANSLDVFYKRNF
ncbi:translocation/assembly module TamB [Pseudomonas sp. C27(2019)]|uniref:translocation/assembly module TamB domain-containing protein n=1 Tax=Pseudomonas sp. C27(2019) TaxID=2604941 RepID=UPI00124531AD|nr:translocation/assembly module TamB domain-containing protein [Pseudomonas sp. C27(2019)]QEY59183.1 translocation/assembly module TamB [Pseudomonas sp. C27(2019)]